MFPSATYEAVKRRRLAGITARASPELLAALTSGRISIRQADMLSRQPARKQRQALWQEQQKHKSQLAAAQVIRPVLATEGRPELRQISKSIIEALQKGTN
jgi:hypothetical protein